MSLIPVCFVLETKEYVGRGMDYLLLLLLILYCRPLSPPSATVIYE